MLNCWCITWPVGFKKLITKRRLLYLKTQFVPRSKHFYLGYKNQSVYSVSGTSRCLFSDKYKTHKYSVDRTYSCLMLHCWCITWPVGFKRLNFSNNYHKELLRHDTIIELLFLHFSRSPEKKAFLRNRFLCHYFCQCALSNSTLLWQL